MQAASRPYVMAAAAVAATSMVAVTPLATKAAEVAAKLPVVSMATKLVDSESLLNVPLNLFYDLINIPANEIYATQFFTDNLFMAGPWFVVSPTNLWGVDPGDPTHFMSVINFLLPFTALNGMDEPETDFTGGLGQQVWGFVASELPTSAGCDEAACAPLEPESPITGLNGVDFYVWLDQILSGQEKFSLFDNWFDPQYGPDGTYYFNPAADGSTDPSSAVSTGVVNPFDGWSTLSTSNLLGGQGIPGTGDVDGYTTAMPWSGDTYTFEPWVPFENFFNSLMETPSTSGLDGTGIDPIYGDPTEIMQTFQSFLAGLMMFDPFTPGSPFCPGECTSVTTAGLDYPDLIKDINNLTPGGNPVINEWLADYANGTANVPSAATIQNSIALLQDHNFWDFQNPPYLGENNPGTFDLATLAPEFHQFWTELGFTVPPLADASDYPAAATSAAAAATSIDPNTFSTDVSALTASLATVLPADFLSTLDADLTSMLAPLVAALPADILAQLPADLLSGL
jgi:hypothetical protein